MKGTGLLGTLAIHFGTLSLLAVGGASTMLPEMHRHAVDVQQWMTDREFSELFGIAQAAPGPNVLIVTLIGWKAAGFFGAVVATVAMCAPSCVLTFVVSRWWHGARSASWRAPVQSGLGAITVGLIAATAFLLSRAADTSWPALAITIATAAFMLTSQRNPLWMLALGALIGACGLIPG